MNRVYKVIWSAVSHSYIAVFEFARGKGKVKHSKKLMLVLPALLASASIDAAEGPIKLGENAVAPNSTWSIDANADDRRTGLDFGYSGGLNQGSTYTMAIGNNSKASSHGSIALGDYANSDANGAMAFGHVATSLSRTALAFGPGAYVAADSLSAMAMGAWSASRGIAAVSYGANSTADGNGAVAMGYSAYAGKQGSIAIGGAASKAGATTDTDFNKAESTYVDSAMAVGIGHNVKIGSDADSSLALGDSAVVKDGAKNSVALGANSVADTANTVSVGSTGAERKITNVAVGDVEADSTDVVTGSQLFATNNDVKANADAIKVNSTGIAANKTAIETNTTDIAANKTAIETNSADIATSKTAIAANTADIATNTAGLASQGVTLAQHGGQLSGLATSLGGGAAVNEDGSFKAPVFKVQGSDRNTVSDALTALDTSVTSNSNSIGELQTSLNSGSTGLVRQDADSGDITVAAASGGRSVSFAGSEGTRTLSGVKDGRLVANSSEVVTGGQLFTTNNRVQANTDAIDVNSAGIAANKNAIGTNRANIEANKAAIETNSADIATSNKAIKANTADIATNTTDIAANKTAIDTNSADIATSKTAIAANTADIATNTAGLASQSITLSQHDGQLIGLAASLGGGAAVNEDGSFKAPVFKVQGSDRNTVSDALTALDSSVTSNSNSIGELQTSLNSGSTGLVRQDADSGDITVAAASGGKSVSFAGSEGVRTLSGIKDGLLAADSSEAVTGGQLFTTNNLVKENADAIKVNSTGIAANKTAIETNTTDIATNTAGLASQGVTLSQHGGQLSGLATSLGGGAAVNEDGSFKAPVFKVQGSDRNTVSDALAALDTSVTSNSDSIGELQTSLNSGSTGLVRQDADSGDITVAAASGGKSVNFAGSEGVRTLSGVKDGLLAADSSEAVTGGQLFTTNNLVKENADAIKVNSTGIAANKTAIETNTTDIATNTAGLASQGVTLSQHGGQLIGLVASLGGGAAVNEDGSFKAPVFKVQGSDRNTVSDALTALDSSVTSNSNSIGELQTSLNSGSTGLVRQDADSGDITVAAASGGKSVSFAGSEGVRTLSGIKDGLLAADSSEAVTGSQLFATNTQMQANTDAIRVNSNDISELQTSLDSGSTGLVRQDADSGNISVASASGGKSVSFAGSEGARTLSGVKDGLLAANSSEAVTGGQLYQSYAYMGNLADALGGGGCG